MAGAALSMEDRAALSCRVEILYIASQASILQRAQCARDSMLIAMRAASPELVELALKPAMNTTALFGIVTLAAALNRQRCRSFASWSRI